MFLRAIAVLFALAFFSSAVRAQEEPCLSAPVAFETSWYAIRDTLRNNPYPSGLIEPLIPPVTLPEPERWDFQIWWYDNFQNKVFLMYTDTSAGEDFLWSSIVLENQCGDIEYIPDVSVSFPLYGTPPEPTTFNKAPEGTENPYGFQNFFVRA